MKDFEKMNNSITGMRSFIDNQLNGNMSGKSVDDYPLGFGQKVTKNKKIKDPNEPKRPISSYFFFIADKREEIKAGLPEE